MRKDGLGYWLEKGSVGQCPLGTFAPKGFPWACVHKRSIMETNAFVTLEQFGMIIAWNETLPLMLRAKSRGSALHRVSGKSFNENLTNTPVVARHLWDPRKTFLHLSMTFWCLQIHSAYYPLSRKTTFPLCFIILIDKCQVTRTIYKIPRDHYCKII